MRVQTCPAASVRSFRAYANSAYECADISAVGFRLDSCGRQLCELCPRRIAELGPHRPHGAGRAHDKCIKAQMRAAASTAAPPLTPVQRKQRTKRPYDTLRPTQQRERRKQARLALQTVHCPLEALRPDPPPPAALIHLPTSVREQIRSVQGLHIPCEQTIIACKRLLATTHATETDTFASGAYITDPVRYVSVLCAQ